MGFEQYHEPAAELSAETRTFARMIASLGEEAEAINWYEQRMSVEPDAEAKAIMENAQEEEFKHFGMDLEFLLRRKPKWRAALAAILFTEGDIVEPAIEAEGIFAATGLTTNLVPTLERLANLNPTTLAIMHGSSYAGDGAAQLFTLSGAYSAMMAA